MEAKTSDLITDKFSDEIVDKKFAWKDLSEIEINRHIHERDKVIRRQAKEIKELLDYCKCLSRDMYRWKFRYRDLVDKVVKIADKMEEANQ